MNEPSFPVNTLSETNTETTPISKAPTVFKLICVSKCKKHAVEMAKQLRPSNKFTRVSEDFLLACEGNLRAFIASRVKAHPSKGKTLT
jgi:hypothetical protein